MTWLDELAEKSLARERPTRAEALNVLKSTDDELMDVVAAAFGSGCATSAAGSS